MAQVAVEVIGGRELRKALNEVGGAANDELIALHKRMAQMVLDRALPNIPMRSGKLKKSAKAVGTKASARVQIGKKALPYAGVIHYGNPRRNIKPQPFLTNALEEVDEIVVSQYRREIAALVRRYGLEPF